MKFLAGLSYLPIHKADWVNYSRLNNLPAREDPPGHSIRLHIRSVGQVAALHENINGHILIVSVVRQNKR